MDPKVKACHMIYRQHILKGMRIAPAEAEEPTSYILFYVFYVVIFFAGLGAVFLASTLNLSLFLCMCSFTLLNYNRTKSYWRGHWLCAVAPNMPATFQVAAIRRFRRRHIGGVTRDALNPMCALKSKNILPPS
jgi:hypothetical protein